MSVLNFSALSDAAFVRQAQLVKTSKNSTPVLPFSAATLWRMVKAKQFSAPVKFGRRMTGWRVSDVRQWLTSQGGEA